MALPLLSFEPFGNTSSYLPCTSTRSTDSWRFADSPQRIPTVRSFSSGSCEMTKCSSSGTRPLARKLTMPLEPSRHNLSVLFFNKLKGLSFLSFSHGFKFSERNSLIALLAATFKYFQVFEYFDSCAHLQQQSFNSLLRFATLRLLLACALLARLLYSTALLGE
jgi:hypothetical protein